MEEETRAPVRELERAEVPWVVAYLREDLQDLRNDVRENSKAIRDSYERLDAMIDSLRKDMDARFEELRREMGTNMRWMITTMVAVGALIVAAIKLLP